MSLLFPQHQYPLLNAQVSYHDMYLPPDVDMTVIDSQEPYSPPKLNHNPFVKSPMTSVSSKSSLDLAAPVAQAPQNNEGIISIICRILCCCRRSRNASTVRPETAATTEFTAAKKEIVFKPIHPLKETTLRPILSSDHLSDSSTTISYTHPSPSSLARTAIEDEIRARAYTDPINASVVAEAVFWRRNMIKDTILPAPAVCELIIRDKYFHELLIIKTLLQKPEHAGKIALLSRASQKILSEFKTGRTSPLLNLMASTPKLALQRHQRAHTDPTPAAFMTKSAMQ